MTRWRHACVLPLTISAFSWSPGSTTNVKGEVSEAPLDHNHPETSNSERKSIVDMERRECSSCSKCFSGYKSSHFNTSLHYPEVFLDGGSSCPSAQGTQSFQQTFQPETSPQGTILIAILAPFLHTTPAEHPHPFPTESSLGFVKPPTSPDRNAPGAADTTQTNPFPKIHHPTQWHVNHTPNMWQWTICSLLIKN